MTDVAAAQQAGGRASVRRLVAIALALVGAKLGIGVVLAWVFAAGRGDELAGSVGQGSLGAALLQIALYLAVGAMILVRRRAGLGIAATYVGYVTAAILARGDVGPWEVMALATGAALMATLLALWPAGAERPRAARSRRSAAPLLAGAAAGLAAALAIFAV